MILSLGFIFNYAIMVDNWGYSLLLNTFDGVKRNKIEIKKCPLPQCMMLVSKLYWAMCSQTQKWMKEKLLESIRKKLS